MVAHAQLESFIDLAAKMAQGGVVLILIVLLLLAIWALKGLFDAYRESAQSTIVAITTQTEALRTMTSALEANERASDANRLSIQALKETINTWAGDNRRERMR